MKQLKRQAAMAYFIFQFQWHFRKRLAVTLWSEYRVIAELVAAAFFV